MNAIIKEKEFPKFLKVNKLGESCSINKHLKKPLKAGELVKVVPFKKQTYADDARLLHMYVDVVRKDKKGEWGITETWGWPIFDLLK